MTSRRRPIIGLLLLTGLLLTCSPACPVQSNCVPSAPGQMHVRLDPLRPVEVRLRKLHLVRPDLIPYPIEYEVVC
jgi:hypothetical protein